MNDLVRNALMGTAGGAAADGEFVDNLFAAHFYNGVPGGSTTVTTGVDLSGSNEGMIWVKNSYASSLQLLYDTIRGGGNAISPDRTSAQSSQSDGPATFTSNGVTTSFVRARANTSLTPKLTTPENVIGSIMSSLSYFNKFRFLFIWNNSFQLYS